MKTRLLFVPGHLCDESLYAAQIEALSPHFDCQIMTFREETSIQAIGAKILASQPSRFAYVGLSMGGYVGFELIRQAPERLIKIALLDTKATPDTPAGKQARMDDRAKAQAQGMTAFSQDLPARWMHPEHARDTKLADRVKAMAQNIGAKAQVAQQEAMMSRPDSLPNLARLACPSLLVCGREDSLTTVADHDAIALHIRQHRRDSEYYVIERCGHLSTMEHPGAVNQLLSKFLSA